VTAVTSNSVSAVVSIVKDDIVRELINHVFVVSTVIVQSEYVPSLRESKVIVLFPWNTIVVLEEQEPPYLMVPAILEENV
jgi:ribosomal protein L14